MAIRRPAIAGPTKRASVHHDAVQADGVRQVVPAHHLHDEALARRVVEDVHEAEEQREQVHLPQVGVPGRAVPERHEQPEHESEDPRRCLGDEEEAPLVDPVRHEPSPHTHHEHGQELQRRGDPHVQPGLTAVAQVADHQPGLGDALHPRPDHRDQLADDIEAVVADTERTEGRAHYSAEAAHSSSAKCSINDTNSQRCSRSPGDSRASRRTR